MALLAGQTGVLLLAAAEPTATAEAILESPSLRLRLKAGDGSYQIEDRRAGVAWRSNPFQPRFGEVTLAAEGRQQRANLDRCEVTQRKGALEATFHPLTNQPAAWLRVSISLLRTGDGLEFAYAADEALRVVSVRLLDQALGTTDADQGHVLVPVREGLLIPADSGLAFSHGFDTYSYEGCHMTMLGVVKRGAAALVSWGDPYTLAEINSTLSAVDGLEGRQAVCSSLVLRKSAKSFQLRLLGRGDPVTIGQAYRQLARERGWLVTWAEKLKGHPERARLFGAINYKLWSTLDRQMNEESTKEQSARVNWTFDEAARIAAHLKNDLGLEKVLFLMGGWIHRGYDNQHPDILPAAPECGGDAALADCARRVRELGFVFGLHDNYQDMYRDAPSWDESYLARNADGVVARGGHWAGGRAFLTCSQRALELAQRPQNLAAVRRLTGADAYFIDTTYAAGLIECFDPKHPLTRAGDMKWKQALSDYARGLYGIFGSECGREWAIPHSDFFEGLTGVSGTYYHDTGLLKKLGAVPVPLFEIVYRDCIAMYGKYGYDPAQAAEYVLHHIAIGRPLHYHEIPPHLYWQQAGAGADPLSLRPTVATVVQTAPRQFRITYSWSVTHPPTNDWRVFVHFTDASGAIKFQSDYTPPVPVPQWPVGEARHGPFSIEVPEGLTGVFGIRAGLFQPESGQRALLLGRRDEERRCRLGRLRVTADKIAFEPPAAAEAGVMADPGVFVSSDQGWAAGLHPLDRFVKNTYEVLSPLHELTAQALITRHEFLRSDRRAQRTVFGSGPSAVEAVVNGSAEELRHSSPAGNEVVLPPYGFLIESPTFVAFHARSWNGLRYDAPVLFTVRALDGRPLSQSRQVRVFHGFGDPRLRLGSGTHTVPREAILGLAGGK